MKHLHLLRTVFVSLALLVSATSLAQERPLWLRFASISPDGGTIAFCYKGDIFTVPTTGGLARQITTNAAYDVSPVWSPDGQKLAFASSREGSQDIFVVSKNGGLPHRLTTDSGSETPLCWLDNGRLLFQMAGLPTTTSAFFTSSQFPQTYVVGDTVGLRPLLFNEMTMCDPSVNAHGDILYHDQKGYEDTFRKHHRSPITRDIWLLQNGHFSKLTSFNGEDRNPVWAQDGRSFYYLSEEDGTFNVWYRSLDGSGKQQLTHYKGNPVRYLSASQNGTLCYCYDGEIYTLQKGGEPRRLEVSIVSDVAEKDLIRQTLRSGATEIDVSPNGKEVAFVAHGDVYVTSIEYNTTKQVTDTPEQERSITFSPDGRSIAYASERNGLWQIYQTSIVKPAEKNFTYSTDLKEEQLVKSDYTAFQPVYSPDGKSVAFLKNRTELCAVDVKSKKVRTLMGPEFMTSYTDGDCSYEWSPDSKWLLSDYIGVGGWNNPDIALVPADGSQKITDLTESGYSDGNARWVLGGKAMLFSSDRAGYRSHGSWGSERDAYIMFFDLDAYEQFRMNKEERSLFDEAKKAKKDSTDKAPVDVSKKKETPKKEELVLDTVNCRDRVMRLTANSSRLADFIIDPKGENLYYLSAFESGFDLWKRDLKEGRMQIIAKGIGAGGLQPDKNFKNLYMLAGGIKQVAVPGGAQKPINYEASFNYRPQKEREYIFNHVWKQVKDKFYVSDLHGADWDQLKLTYGRFLPYINNNYDFRDLLSEMLGELNGSHTGSRYYPTNTALATAQLGLFYDQNYTGDGLKIKEVIKGGPFAVRDTKVKAGDIIKAIDGQEIKAGKDYNALLDGKVRKAVRITVQPQSGKDFDVTVRPISKGDQNDLLYKRWVDRNEHLVDSLSHGQLAYVHVRAMNSDSYREVFSRLLNNKNRNRKAVIVDERHNGGGWLHDDLCTLLSGRQYQSFYSMGRYVGYDPWNKWVRPSCVLVCEDDYSNGHGFPMVYKALGIGKIIGAPVAGTMTAVWWETMMNGMVFGIPQVGCKDMSGRWGENQQLNPDVVVYNSPEDYLTGNDAQLKRAVEEMLK